MNPLEAVIQRPLTSIVVFAGVLQVLALADIYANKAEWFSSLFGTTSQKDFFEIRAEYPTGNGYTPATFSYSMVEQECGTYNRYHPAPACLYEMRASQTTRTALSVSTVVTGLLAMYLVRKGKV